MTTETPQSRLWRRQHALRHVTARRALRTCRTRAAWHVGDAVHVRHAEGAPLAHYSGLLLCGSASACPCCAASVAHVRQAAVEAMAERHLARGDRLVTCVLTLHHSVETPLRDALDALHAAWAYVWSPRKTVRSLGLVGAVRGTEGTWGAQHGWHPHVHVLAVLRADADADAIGAWIRERWEHGLERIGWRGGWAQNGKLAERHDAAGVGYVAKGAAFDTVSSARKTQAHSVDSTDLRMALSVHPFELLDRTDDSRAVALWHEWEEATVRLRTFGVVERKALLLDAAADLADEDAARQADDVAAPLVATVGALVYRRLSARQAEYALLRLLTVRDPWTLAVLAAAYGSGHLVTWEIADELALAIAARARERFADGLDRASGDRHASEPWASSPTCASSSPTS